MYTVIVKEVPQVYWHDPKYHWFENIKTKKAVNEIKRDHKDTRFYRLEVKHADGTREVFTKSLNGNWKKGN
jgi:hypothetical protein